MGLRRYIIRRIIYSFVLILAVISVNFIIFQLMPGDPAQSYIMPDLTPEQVKFISELYGLEESLFTRYVKCIKNLLTFDFGFSFRTLNPVSDEIGMRIANTILLIGTATTAAIIIGVLLGVIVAHKRGHPIDSLLVSFSLTTYSLPTFWMGMLALAIFGFTLQWFPTRGVYPEGWVRKPPIPLTLDITSTPQQLGVAFNFNSNDLITFITGRLYHLLLPVSVLTIFYFGGYLLLTRATMLEALTEDFVVTARAKGLPERVVLYKHALKCASLPLITSVALAFGGMLGGAIITEQVFTWTGLGHWIWLSVIWQDYPAMQAIFYIIALCIIIANFIADLAYGVIDPRIKYG